MTHRWLEPNVKKLHKKEGKFDDKIYTLKDLPNTDSVYIFTFYSQLIMVYSLSFSFTVPF